MPRINIAIALVFAITFAANADHCNRGNRSRPSSNGRISPLSSVTASGTSSPLASFNPLSTSANSNPMALLRYQSQMFQQQRLLAQQQLHLRTMALRQAQLERQLQQLHRERSEHAPAATDPSPTVLDKRRQRYAEREFQLAQKAQTRGRDGSAVEHYRRVIRIAGRDSELGEKSRAALETLPTQQDE